MTSLAIEIGKGHAVVTGAAIPAFKNVGHGILSRPFFDPEYLRVAKFAPVPYGMLLVGENYFGHLNLFGQEGQVFRSREFFSRDRYSLDGVREFNYPVLLGLFPV